MTDLIDRNQLLKWLKVSDFENYTGDECFRLTIQEIENAPAVNLLIPCSEQLPDKDGTYLVYSKFGFEILEYDVELKEFGMTDTYKDELGYDITEWYSCTVTHWMSLPEKPEDLNNE